VSKKNMDELIALAKNMAEKAAASEETSRVTPEVMDAIQAVATQIKHRAGHDADLAALVEHVQSLVKNANQNK